MVLVVVLVVVVYRGSGPWADVLVVLWREAGMGAGTGWRRCYRDGW